MANGNEEEQEVEETPFDFIEWGRVAGLKKKTTDLLKKQDLDTAEVFLELTPGDVAALDITIGQARSFKAALCKLGNEAFIGKDTGEEQKKPTGPEDDPDMIPAGQKAPNKEHEAILNAGELLDQLFKDPDGAPALDKQRDERAGRNDDLPHGAAGYTPPATGGIMQYDPRVMLTIRAVRKKALHIKDFVSDSVKTRIAKKRREELKVHQGPEGAISLHPVEDGAFYISQSEWGSANMRLLNQLLKSGDLPRGKFEYYMTFTAMIHELASVYDWLSVLEYEDRYREEQAESGAEWGMPAPHLDYLLLVPKRRADQHNQPPQIRSQKKKHQNRPKQFPGGQGYQRSAPAPKQELEQEQEICKLFASSGGECKFGDKCKYMHIKDE